MSVPVGTAAVRGGLAFSAAATVASAVASATLRGRARLASAAVAAASGAAFATAAYAHWIEPRWLETTRTAVWWAGPPLRVGVLTDLHVGPRHPSVLTRAIARLARAQIDLALLGGDYVAGLDAAPDKLDALAPLADLRAPLGVFGVLGNHDTEPAGEGAPRAEAIRRRLEELGVTVLRNQSRALDTGDARDARVILVGLGSFRAGDTDARRAFDGLDARAPTIVLTHNWRSLRATGVGRFDVAIAGHTHGGQGCVPGTQVCPPLEPDMKPYVAGAYDWPAGGVLYVSRGLGESSAVARIGCRPEVTVIDLLPREASG